MMRIFENRTAAVLFLFLSLFGARVQETIRYNCGLGGFLSLVRYRVSIVTTIDCFVPYKLIFLNRAVNYSSIYLQR